MNLLSISVPTLYFVMSHLTARISWHNPTVLHFIFAWCLAFLSLLQSAMQKGILPLWDRALAPWSCSVTLWDHLGWVYQSQDVLQFCSTFCLVAVSLASSTNFESNSDDSDAVKTVLVVLLGCSGRGYPCISYSFGFAMLSFRFKWPGWRNFTSFEPMYRNLPFWW